MFGLRKIIKMFDNGNVMVFGLRGKGKDMLFSNVVVRRNLPYVSNVNYGGQFFEFNPLDFNCGENSYRNFISKDIKYYKFPYPDRTDLYLSDAGVYFPAQYNNELNRDYKYFPTYFALSRHTSLGNVHTNAQSISRCWDKIREQCDQYIMCRFCVVLFGKLVIQKVRIYELYESANRRVPPFRLRRPLFNVDGWLAEREHYEQQFGVVKEHWLIYRHLSNYDTRVFKTILEGGKKG